MLSFRKCGVVVLVVLILASLTIGSINPMGASGTISAGGSLDRAGGQGFPEAHGAMAHMMGMITENGTTVILDMSRDPATPDNVVAYVHSHEMVRTNSYDFIKGNMIVQRPGMEDRSFPVMWVRSAPQALENGLMVASFVADMNIPADLMRDPAQGFMSDGNHFVFHSMINFTGPILSSPTSTTVASGDYDNQIGEGQTVYHTQEITAKSTSVSVDLKWQNASDSLRLMIYTPDGHTLGPYYDSSDGKTDGDINLNITNTDGVATGTWSFKVTGTDVTGSEGYYIRAW